jgi:predicted transcriptional regulator
VKQKSALLEQFQNPAEKPQKELNSIFPNTQLHNRSLSELGTGTSIKSGEVKVVQLAQTIHKKHKFYAYLHRCRLNN